MAEGRKKLAGLLRQPPQQAPLRKGRGYELSVEQPNSSQDETAGNPEIQKTVKLEGAAPKAERVKLGDLIRKDLLKACKQIATEEDRFRYQVIEEALEQYIERRKQRGQEDTLQ